MPYKKKKPAASNDHWAFDYFKKNPFKTLSATMTGLGFSIISAYHFLIEYSPPYDLQSFASVVLEAAFVGLVISLALNSVFFVWFYVFLFADEGVKLKSSSAGDSESQLLKVGFANVVSRSEQKDTADINNRIFNGRLVVATAVALFGFMGTVLVSMLWHSYSGYAYLFCLFFPALFSLVFEFAGFWISKLAKDPSQPERFGCRAASLFVLLLFSTCALSLVQESMRTALSWMLCLVWLAVFAFLNRKRKSEWNTSLSLMLVVWLQLVPVLLLFVLITHSPLASQKDIDWLALLGACLFYFAWFILGGVYLIHAWRPQSRLSVSHRLSSVIIALIFPLVATWFLGVSELLPNAIMAITKIGNFEAVEMTVSDNACKIIAEKGNDICQRPSTGGNKICHVYVRSRIGSESFLVVTFEKSDKEDKRVIRPIYLPSKEVLGLKVDTGIRKITKHEINQFLENRSSVCSESKTADSSSVGGDGDKGKPNGSDIEPISIRESELFDFDKFELSERGQRKLKSLIPQLISPGSDSSNPAQLEILVLGFADQIGSPYHNISLSQLRAVAVADFLRMQLSRVMPEALIRWNGGGSSHLKKTDVDCPPRMAKAERIGCLADNRRVEIQLTRREGMVPNSNSASRVTSK